MEQRAVIFSGVGSIPPGVVPFIPRVELIVVVDSGYGIARQLGIRPDLLVGDLDSISADDLAHAEANGVQIERHPVDKDATDLDLGVAAARRAGAVGITIMTGTGDRVDHLFAELALFTRLDLAPIRIDAWVGHAHLNVLHGPATRAIGGRLDELVTLAAVHGPASGIVTTGLAYKLSNESLLPGETRGVSNRVVAPPAAVRVQAGSLVVIRPNAAV